jgi:hypothetical protein
VFSLSRAASLSEQHGFPTFDIKAFLEVRDPYGIHVVHRKLGLTLGSTWDSSMTCTCSTHRAPAAFLKFLRWLLYVMDNDLSVPGINTLLQLMSSCGIQDVYRNSVPVLNARANLGLSNDSSPALCCRVLHEGDYRMIREMKALLPSSNSSRKSPKAACLVAFCGPRGNVSHSCAILDRYRCFYIGLPSKYTADMKRTSSFIEVSESYI